MKSDEGLTKGGICLPPPPCQNLLLQDKILEQLSCICSFCVFRVCIIIIMCVIMGYVSTLPVGHRVITKKCENIQRFLATAKNQQ